MLLPYNTFATMSMDAAVAIFYIYTFYITDTYFSTITERLCTHSCVADLDEHVGVCTCMFVCVSVLSLPPSFPLCVYYLSLSLYINP